MIDVAKVLGNACFAPKACVVSNLHVNPPAKPFGGIAPAMLRNPAAAHERQRTQTGQSRDHQEWDFKGVLPVLMVWLIFYAVVIIGSLTGTRPAAMTPQPAFERAPPFSIR